MTRIEVCSSPLDSNVFAMAALGALVTERTEKVAPDEMPALSVGQRGVTSQLEGVAKQTTDGSRKLVRPGDLVINSRADRRGASGVASQHGSVSLVYSVMKPNLNILEPRFGHHLLRSVGFQEEFFRWGTGIVSDLWSTNFTRMGRIRVPIPPIPAQRYIADYLDRETGEIDAMIAKMDQLAETLDERRDAAWGVEFQNASSLGATVKLSLLIESIADGPFGSSLTSSHYSEEGARVVRLGNIGVNSFRNEDKAFIPLDYARKLDTHAVIAGDVVVAGLGDERMPLGRATVLPDIGPAIVKADCYRVRPNKLVSARYLAWALSAPQARSQFRLLSRGTTRARLNTKVVQEVEIPLITRDQQDRLLERQHVLVAQMDQMLAKVAELKSLLTERRAALITEVVTGRKEVA